MSFRSPIADESADEAEDQEWTEGTDEPEVDYELASQQSQAGRGRKRISKCVSEFSIPKSSPVETQSSVRLVDFTQIY